MAYTTTHVWATDALQLTAVTIVQVRTSPELGLGLAPTIDPSRGAVGMSMRIQW